MRKAKKILYLTVLLMLVLGNTAYAAFSAGHAWETVVETIGKLAGSRAKSFQEKAWYESAEPSELPESREESGRLIIEELDKIIGSAYEYNIGTVREEAEAMGLDADMTLNTYYREGDVLSNIDYAYLLSVYSLKDPHLTKTLEGMKEDFRALIPRLSTITLTPVDSEAPENGEQIRKVPVYKYKKVSVELCRDYEKWVQIGTTTSTTVNPDGSVSTSTEPVYGWKVFHDSYTEEERYYVREKDEEGNEIVDFWITDEDGVLVTDYEVAELPFYDDEDHMEDPDHLYEDSEETYYEIGEGDGEEPEKIRIFPEFYRVDYAVASSRAFTNDEVWELFGIDREAFFFETMQGMSFDHNGNPGTAVHHDDAATNEEIANMRYQYFREYYGEALAFQNARFKQGLSAEEINRYLSLLPEDTPGNRKQVIKTALALVNQISYCNNGEDSKPKMTGYDPSWYDYARCDQIGRPSGLDSSGFIEWAFWTAGFSEEECKNLHTTPQISNKLSEIVKVEDIKPGDIGLVQLGITNENNEVYNRVGIYLGKDTDGTDLWIVNSSVDNTVIVSKSENFKSIKVFSERMEEDDLYSEEIIFYGGGSTAAGGNMYTIAQIILQECSDGGIGTAAVAECVKNRAVDTTEFGNVSDAWSVLTQKGQFEAYGSGAYKAQVPNGAVIDMISQVFSGSYTVLNNPHVLYFVSAAYHRKNYGKPDNFRSKMAVFGTFGDNVYYVKHEFLNYRAPQGNSVLGSINASKMTAEARSYMGNVSEKRQQIVLYASSCVGQIPYYLGWREVFGFSVYPGDLNASGFGTVVRSDPYKMSRRLKGLDCSGFVDFVLETCGIKGFWSNDGSLGTGDIQRSSKTVQISKSELKPGDLGFKFIGDSVPSEGLYNHVGIYAGNGMWVHCSSDQNNMGAMLNAYSKFTVYYRVQGVD